MITRVQELCRKLQPVLGKKVDGLWRAYLAESDATGRADIEQTLELLAAKHLGQSYQPDRSPFPPPSSSFAGAGDIGVGDVSYGQRELYPFNLRSGRLKEHVLVAGRSGSGKTNLTFVLILGMMNRGIKVLALDWKRGYRDLLKLHPELRVYTIGRDVSPFRFNPLIPPPGCEPQVWIKLIVDVIASAYLGGEGVISLLVAGLDHLFREAGVFDMTQTHWPTIHELLVWLKSVKLRGRAAMWQASAERILLAMTYGEFEAIVNTQSTAHIQELLDHNVVFEMDGLSAASDRVMFSEALTLWLYRYRLAQGPRDQLTNVVVLEEAHNLLHRKASDTRESVLETSIRMTRQFGLGYVFVDQSASLLSQVAFANSYATLALSQKLKADVQTISAAMNLSDEQRDALTTLSIGTAVVRLADEHPEPFMVKIPRCPVREGCVSDQEIRVRMSGYSGESMANSPPAAQSAEVSPIPPPDRYTENKKNPHPPTPEESRESVPETLPRTPAPNLNRDEIRFLHDVATRPLSTTVSRYHRLHLSRRRGNAIRQEFASRGLIEAVPIATRSGQVVLYQITSEGRAVCSAAGIDPGPISRASLEHHYWVNKVSDHFERKGYAVSHEHQIKGNGAVDVLAECPGDRVAIEVETGKSDIKGNLSKLRGKGFDRVVVVATSAAAVAVCQKVVHSLEPESGVELVTWLDY